MNRESESISMQHGAQKRICQKHSELGQGKIRLRERRENLARDTKPPSPRATQKLPTRELTTTAATRMTTRKANVPKPRSTNASSRPATTRKAKKKAYVPKPRNNNTSSPSTHHGRGKGRRKSPRLQAQTRSPLRYATKQRKDPAWHPRERKGDAKPACSQSQCKQTAPGCRRLQPVPDPKSQNIPTLSVSLSMELTGAP